ncbi:hypothetical protein LAU_0433 [Lausannevirus]|nr:hypothetical protein LAU_0433 [Lausannevirus]AEA07283.1 hypothetical protein LAU_0433 [Lausannevirus]
MCAHMDGFEGAIRAIPNTFATTRTREIKKMNAEERAKALEYAHVLVQKINDKLEVEFPINVDFTSTHVLLSFMQGGTPNIRRLASIDRNNMLTDHRVIYPVYGEEDAVVVSEDDVINKSLSIIKADTVYSNSVISKKLGTLNNNFSKLFEFLRESVELVPGGDEEKRLSESFMEKAHI